MSGGQIFLPVVDLLVYFGGPVMERATSDMNHIGTVCLFVVAESVVRSDNCLEGMNGSENIRRLP